MLTLVSEAVRGEKPLDTVTRKLDELRQTNFIRADEIRDALVPRWEGAAEHFLDDGVLDESEEQRLMALIEQFGLTQEDLDRHGAFSRVIKAAVLRDVMHGQCPERVKVDGQLPFNFHKEEKLIWLFTNVAYDEDKARTQYVGGSSGVSVRIARGVYYRIGAFRGRSVSTTERLRVDTGLMAVTNKYIYFGGPRKSFRVPYTKIVSFIPYSDGIGIVKDAANAKQQLFVTGDGWFTYNLVVNVSRSL